MEYGGRDNETKREINGRESEREREGKKLERVGKRNRDKRKVQGMN